MANIFNSVQGLHPKRNAFSALTYRTDFSAPLGVNIPVYLQEVPPATRIKCSTSALIRLQALIAPVMDNIDYYVHFWKLPYRLIENDRFTAFISGEIEVEDYDALFSTCDTLAKELVPILVDLYNGDPDFVIDAYNAIFGNGSVFDFLGYDASLFPTLSYGGEPADYIYSGGNSTDILNWRSLIAYFMLHQNWYMNENVPYFENFVSLVDDLVKEQSLSAFCELLARTAHMHGDFSCSFLPHGWEKDYFTSALPNVQYGTPVSLPIVGNAPVTIDTSAMVINGKLSDGSILFDCDTIIDSTGDPVELHRVGGGDPDLSHGVMAGSGINNVKNIYGAFAQWRSDTSEYDTDIQGTADLSNATAITINELRFANALQVFKERQMRYGRRRLEYYKGFFDVSPEDLRLQVPKYIGGGRIPINISDIEQTSATTGSSALGHLAGKATAVAGGFAGFSTFCSEETVIIGIAFAMPHITYAQSLSRFKLKTNDVYDYFNPSFEHLGEQAVKNIELYAGTDDPDGDFGYQPRYTEYRFHSNEMHGAFKDSLAFWTLGRIFSDTPALNADFIYMQPSVFDRIFAVSGQPSMLASMLFRVRAVMPVSKYGTPMLLA